MSEQTENLGRVRDSIAPHIIRFIRERAGREFHGADLQQYVASQVNGFIAPGSPDRILRDLRKRGVVDYELLSRSRSLYRAVPLGEQGSLF
jgi:DNA-binding PadR family transcriptional regulator